MDVICAGMYRACSTWQYEVIAHLVERHRGGLRLGYIEGGDYRPGPAPRRWRVLKCHDRHPRFARAIERGEAVAIYAFRDLRDAVDSMRHKTGRSFEQLMNEGLAHRILANDQFWRSRRAVIVQRYDDLIDDPTAGIAALAGFLGLGLGRGEASRIADAFSSTANRRRAREADRRLRRLGIDPRDPVAVARAEPGALLHGHHLRDGRVGRWREAFTEAQCDVLSRVAAPWLARHGFEEPGAATGASRLAAWRSRWHAVVYFAARRRPQLASAAHRALGSGPQGGDRIEGPRGLDRNAGR